MNTSFQIIALSVASLGGGLIYSPSHPELIYREELKRTTPAARDDLDLGPDTSSISTFEKLVEREDIITVLAKPTPLIFFKMSSYC